MSRQTMTGLVLAVMCAAGVVTPAQAAVGVNRCYEDVPVKVRDAFSDPLPGATVSFDASSACSGSPATEVTNANGVAYVDFVGDVVDGAAVTVTVAKPGYVPTSGLVRVSLSVESSQSRSAGAQAPALKTLGNDFKLLYTLAGAATPAALQSGNTVTVDATSVAPAPSAGGARQAVVQATDADGTTTVLTEDGSGPGGTAWTMSVAEPTGALEGRRERTLCVVPAGFSGPCSRSASLSELRPVSWIVDDSAPQVNSTSFSPPDGGNTIFANQPLQVDVSDVRNGAVPSGVDPATAVLTLEDTTANTAQTFSGATLAWDAPTFTFTTPPQALTVSHVYRLSIVVADLAGNIGGGSHRSVVDGGGFLAVDADVAPVAATIAPIECTIADGLPGPDGRRQATCSGATLEWAPGTVTLSGSRKPGEGTVNQSLGLAAAQVTSTVAGVDLPPEPAFAQGDPQAAARNTTQTFTATATANPATYPTSTSSLALGDLTIRVPAGAERATLSMTTQSLGNLRSCASSTEHTLPCGPDPIDSIHGWVEGSGGVTVLFEPGQPLSFEQAQGQFTTFSPNGSPIATSPIASEYLSSAEELAEVCKPPDDSRVLVSDYARRTAKPSSDAPVDTEGLEFEYVSRLFWWTDFRINTAGIEQDRAIACHAGGTQTGGGWKLMTAIASTAPQLGVPSRIGWRWCGQSGDCTPPPATITQTLNFDVSLPPSVGAEISTTVQDRNSGSVFAPPVPNAGYIGDPENAVSSWWEDSCLTLRTTIDGCGEDDYQGSVGLSLHEFASGRSVLYWYMGESWVIDCQRGDGDIEDCASLPLNVRIKPG